MPRCNPNIIFGIEANGTDKIPELHSFDKFSIAAINNEAVLLAVAQPHIASPWIDRDAVHHGEFSRSPAVTIPLIDEPSVLVEMDYACAATIVRGRQTDVVRTFVRVTFAYECIAIGRKCN